MGAKMIPSRVVLLILAVVVAMPVGAQVFDVVPYQVVGAFGANNERDTNEGSCDLLNGCFNRNGELCANEPTQACDLTTVPAGRCVTGNRPENVWPSKGGECAGTIGYFERGPAELGNIQANAVGGVPCVTDAYVAALEVFAVDPSRDATQINALEAGNGTSSMCPGDGICAHKRCAVVPAGIGVVVCETNADCTATPEDECIQVNDNTANCQAFEPKPSTCQSAPSNIYGIDADCPKTCNQGFRDGEPCDNSLLDCKLGQIGINPGECIPIQGDCIVTVCQSAPSVACRVDNDCPGQIAGDCSIPQNDFEPGVCGGTQARCSDGDPELDFGGLAVGLCTDIVIIGQIDSSQNCGRNAGEANRTTPRNALENPFFLYTPQRDPGSGFLGTGVTRDVRATSAVRIQDAADASANTLGIRSIATVGKSAWQDAAFSADDVNGSLDSIILGTRCNPPEEWETQLPVTGECQLDPSFFCIADADCSVEGAPGGPCVNVFFCNEQQDPTRPELGPVLDSVSFLWQRDIVDNEPIPAGLPDLYRDAGGTPVWSTNPASRTCPPICGTEYDHTTLAAEAITTLGAADRGSGIQLAFDSTTGRRAGAGDMLAVDAATTVAFVNIGDIRCQMGGQDPSDLVNLGTCTSSRVPCDPDSTGICAPGESCQACGGTLIRAGTGNPLEATKGLNPQAVPIGYDDLGFDILKLVENNRLGVLNGSPTTVTVSIFVVASTGIVASEFTDGPTCNPSGDRCVLGQVPGSAPGSVGLGSGGTFAAGQKFAHGGENRSGVAVSWDSEDRPGQAVPGAAYIRLGTTAVGQDGIPGCMGNNSPRNNASDACRKRLARGQETGQQDPGSTQAKWGFCQGGLEGWLPEPPPPCQTTTQFFNCQFPFKFCSDGTNAGLACTVAADCPGGFCPPAGDTAASCGTVSMEFNTGADDPEILLPVVDDGLGTRTGEEVGPFAPTPGTQPRFARPVIPNASDPKPTFHLVAAGTLRDLDLLEGVDNTDVVFKADVTSCPINLATGKPECAVGGVGDPCDGQGGDTDGDTLCDDDDPCIHFANTLPLVISNFVGIPDECYCGDFDNNHTLTGGDAQAINQCAGFVRFDCDNTRDDVDGNGVLTGNDAARVNRVAGFLDPAYLLTCSRRPEGTCGGNTGVACF